MLFKLNQINLNQIHQALRSGGFLLWIALSLPLSSLAQKDKALAEMTKDENGKYIYYEVVEKNSISTDTLVERVAGFLKTKKLKDLSSKVGQVAATGKFIISKTAFVLAHPSGEVSYSFQFETKEGKYRFWLTDFMFIPYLRDRYGNFVPSTVKGTPLESDPGKLNAVEWTSYISSVNQQAAAFAEQFKTWLITNSKAKALPEPKKSVSTRSW